MSRVLVNSLPKSGTHLLEKAIQGFGYSSYMDQRGIAKRIIDKLGYGTPRFYARPDVKNNSKPLPNENRDQKSKKHNVPIGVFSPYYVAEKEIEVWLESIKQGQYIKGHVPYSGEFNQVIQKSKIAHIVVVRDPRAVISSMENYVTDAKNWTHFLEPDMKKLDKNEKFQFILYGGYAKEANVSVKSIKESYQSILAWRNSASVEMVRFEDLIGAKGGGSVEDQIAVLSRIARHLGISNTISDLDGVAKNLYDESSPTFRSGQIDGWKNKLTPAQIDMIENVVGDQILECGYQI